MNGYSLLMYIYGALIFLYGLYAFLSKKPYIPRTYGAKQERAYYRFFGKTAMLVSLAPILSASVALINDSTEVLIISMVVFIVTMILAFVISSKCFQK